MRRYWTMVEMRRFRQSYPYASMAALRDEFGRTNFAIKMMAVKLGLKKSPLYDIPRFPEGHRPWNAGKKGWQAGGRARLTQFKKGQRSPRQRLVGAERRTKDGIEIKVAEPNSWMPKARFVWEREIGPIPKGHLVRRRDRDVKISPSNLMLVTKAEHVRLNYRPRRPKPAPAWMRQLFALANRQAA